MNEPSAQPNSSNQPAQAPGQAKSGNASAYMTDAEKKAWADKTKTAGNTPQEKPTVNTNADHHAQAAKCCNKAATEHTFAAKCCASGEHEKAKEHAKNAEEHCIKAQDYGKQAKAA